MLKVVFVLGCLLCLTLANPMDEKVLKRLARSHRFGSNSHERLPYQPNIPFNPNNIPPQFLQLLYALFGRQFTTPPATTTAAAATTTTATTTAAAATTTTATTKAATT